MTRSNRIWILLIAALLCLAVYSFRLGFPPGEYFDESQFLKSARAHLRLEKLPLDFNHPILGKLWLSLSILALGDHPVSWRLLSMVSGWLLVLLMFAISKKMTENFWISLLVAYLFAVEGMHITLARIAMVHIQMLLWMMLSLLAILPYVTRSDSRRTWYFFASGLFLGVAVAIRWVALGIFGVIGILLVQRFFTEEDKPGFIRDFLIFFVFVPVVVYFSSYLILPLGEGKSWADIWNYQKNAFLYHANVQKWHPYNSTWWGWPLLTRSVWFFFHRQGGFVNGIVCIGNPAIYWMIPFAIAYVLFKFLEERKLLYEIILLGFFIQWLPWARISYFNFFYYFSPAMAFATMAIALLMSRIWQIGRLGRGIVIGYVVIVAVLFIYWYPLYTGFPVSEWYFRNHLWFKAWL